MRDRGARETEGQRSERDRGGVRETKEKERQRSEGDRSKRDSGVRI